MQFIRCDHRYTHKPPIHTERHAHAFWQLDVIHRGMAHLDIGGSYRRVDAGSAVIVAPSIPHRYRFDTRVTMSALKFIPECRYTLENNFALLHATPAMLHILSAVFAEYTAEQPFSDTLAAHYLDIFFCKYIVPHTKEQDVAMGRIAAFIEKNHARALPDSMLAAHHGLSLNYFIQRFKRFAGMTPSAYVRHCRIEHAKRIMRSPDVPLSSVAETIGYTDQFTFSKAFKRITGFSPRLYRESSF